MRLYVLIPLLLLVACSREPQSGNARIDPALAEMVPSDTVHLAGGNMAAVKDSPLVQKYAPMFGSLALEGAIDPLRDVDEFLAASNGSDVLVLLRGRFSSPELKKKVAAVPGAALLDDRILLYGPKERVQSAQTIRNKTLPAPITKLLAELPPSPHVWAVISNTTVPAAVPRRGVLSNLDKLLSSIRSNVIWVNVSPSLQLGTISHCNDEAAAKQVHGALKAFVALGRLSTPGNGQELLKVFDAIDITQNASDVRLKADLPLDAVENLLGLARSLRR